MNTIFEGLIYTISSTYFETLFKVNQSIKYRCAGDFPKGKFAMVTLYMHMFTHTCTQTYAL